MSSWKKRWKDELDRDIPCLSAEVLNAKVENITASKTNEKNEKPSFNRLIAQFFSKPLRVCASVMIVCLVSIVLLTTFIKPRGGSDKIYPYAFVVEINPAVALTTDENGNVTSITALNGDADVVLSQLDEERWSQKPIEEVVILYTDLAARLGFIDVSSLKTAVRISANKAENVKSVLELARGELEEYFLSKGVYGVVLCEAVESSVFAERCGVSAETNEGFIDAIKSKFTFTFEDDAENLSEDEIKELYTQNVLSDEFIQWISASITKNLEYVSENLVGLEKIFELNQSIKAHVDNPCWGFKDYWTLKNVYADRIDGELKELVDETEAALRAYEQKTGDKIESEEYLFAVKESFSLFVEFAYLIEEFTTAYLKEHFATVAQIFESCGLFSVEDAALADIPKNIEEYNQKALFAAGKQAQLRVDEFKQSYNAEHSPLKQADYDDYVEALIKNYGSLSAYWQAWVSGDAE